MAVESRWSKEGRLSTANLSITPLESPVRPRFGARASSSSKNMTHGDATRARLNTAMYNITTCLCVCAYACTYTWECICRTVCMSLYKVHRKKWLDLHHLDHDPDPGFLKFFIYYCNSYRQPRLYTRLYRILQATTWSIRLQVDNPRVHMEV